MKNKLIEFGYELKILEEEFSMYVNHDMGFIILIIPKYTEDIDIDKIRTQITKYPYNKKTLAFIKENELDDSIYEDPYYFMKIKGFNEDLIPRKVLKKVLIFKPTTKHQEVEIFYNPYLSTTKNVKNLLKFINTQDYTNIEYLYPKEVSDTLYLKYFFNNILEITEV